MFAVATAVVEIPAPAPGGEHETADIRLVITRGGSEILHRRQYYNVPVSNAALPGDPNTFAGLDPVSLHLQLPGPGAATGPTVTVPEDGGAPNYTQLRTAIEDVLNDEPGNLAGIADLTLKAARHIAREITWDRGAFPLPESDRSLESMFTGPHNADSDEERDRRLFEGDLVTYYVGHDGEADRLTNFVFAMSAAIWCERNSAAAVRAGFVFPVFPSQPDRLTKAHLTRNGGGPLNPPFTVTAEYFYALTALLPPQVARQQRYDIAILQAVPQLTVALTQAIDDGVFSEPAGLTRFQVGAAALVAGPCRRTERALLSADRRQQCRGAGHRVAGRHDRNHRRLLEFPHPRRDHGTSGNRAKRCHPCACSAHGRDHYAALPPSPTYSTCRTDTNSGRGVALFTGGCDAPACVYCAGDEWRNGRTPSCAICAGFSTCR